MFFNTEFQRNFGIYSENLRLGFSRNYISYDDEYQNYLQGENTGSMMRISTPVRNKVSNLHDLHNRFGDERELYPNRIFCGLDKHSQRWRWVL